MEIGIKKACWVCHKLKNINIVTGGEDKIITVSNFNSETLYESITVKAEPRNIQWARSKTDDREA